MPDLDLQPIEATNAPPALDLQPLDLQPVEHSPTENPRPLAGRLADYALKALGSPTDESLGLMGFAHSFSNPPKMIRQALGISNVPAIPVDVPPSTPLGEAIGGTIKGAVEGATTPESVLTLAAGPVGASKFIAQMAVDAPEKAKDYIDALKKGDEKRAEQDALEFGLMAAPAAHVADTAIPINPATALAREIGRAPLNAPLDLQPVSPIIDTSKLPALGNQPTESVAPPDVNLTTKRLPNQKASRIPEVPATPPEPEIETSVIQEIRKRGLTTKAQIQAAFPQSELTREQAGKLWKLAYPDGAPQPKTGAIPNEDVQQLLQNKNDQQESGRPVEGASPQNTAEVAGGPVNAPQQPQVLGGQNASENSETAEVHGDVRPQSGPSEGEVPTAQGGGGIQPQEQPGGETGVAPPPQAQVGPIDPVARKLSVVTSIKNAVVDSEREKRGLPPATPVLKQSFGDVWDKAMQTAEKNPDAGYDLVQSLLKKPRALNAEEDALLLHRQVGLQNDFAKAANDLIAANDSGDLGTQTEARARVAQLSDELQDVYSAGKQSGTETARGLNARKMLAKEDYSLASLEMKKRAINGGRQLTDDERVQLQELHDKVEATQKAFDDYVQRHDIAKLNAETAKELNIHPQVVSFAERFVSTLDRRADAARTRLRAKLQNVGAGVDPTILKDLAEIGASHLAHGVVDFAEWSSKMVSDLGDKVRPYLEDAFKASQARLDDATKGKPRARGAVTTLSAYKKRLRTRIDAYQRRLASGEIAPKPKTPLKLDSEAIRLKAEAEKAKNDVQRALNKDKSAQRTGLEKVEDAFAKWTRVAVLSWPTVLTKLTAAAAWRAAITPLEEGVGAGFGAAFPRVASAAPREGGFNVKAEAKALAEGFTQGAKDAWQTLKTGHSPLDEAFGKPNTLPPEWIDFIGNIHGALKAPVKRMEFTRSLEKRTAWNIQHGVDVSDPMVQVQMGLDAYKDAQKSIFQQNNKVATWISTMERSLEAKDKATGRTPIPNKAAATALRVAVPITKVPFNIISETLQYATGLATGSVELGRAYKNGVESLTPEEADQIMRHLKKGSLGAAALLLGYYGYKDVGGFYQPGEKRSANDVKANAARVFGVNLSPQLLHAPLMEAAQMGATTRRVADSRILKRRGETQGLGSGVVAALLGLTEQAPGFELAEDLNKLRDPRERNQVVDDAVRNRIIPGLVQWEARREDKDTQGNVIKRKPHNIEQNLETGIPVLRKNVPTK